jgi:hypothetical protein
VCIVTDAARLRRRARRLAVELASRKQFTCEGCVLGTRRGEAGAFRSVAVSMYAPSMPTWPRTAAAVVPAMSRTASPGRRSRCLRTAADAMREQGPKVTRDHRGSSIGIDDRH